MVERREYTLGTWSGNYTEIFFLERNIIGPSRPSRATSSETEKNPNLITHTVPIIHYPVKRGIILFRVDS